MAKSKESKKWDLPSLVFLGCMFVGLGFGLLKGRPDAGVLIGLGAGFLASAYAKYNWN